MIDFKLEMAKPNKQEPRFQFYRYGYHNGSTYWKIWFEQEMNTGHIYNVDVALEGEDRPYQIYSDCKEGFYPTFKASFASCEQMCFNSSFEARRLFDYATEVQDILFHLERFFECSEHGELYREKSVTKPINKD